MSLALPDGSLLDLAVHSEFRDGFLHLKGGNNDEAVSLVMSGRDVFGNVLSHGRQYHFESGAAGVAMRETVSAPSNLLENDSVAIPELPQDLVPYRLPDVSPRSSDAAATRQPLDLLVFLDSNLVALLGENGTRASALAKTDLTTMVFGNSGIPNATVRVVGFRSGYLPGAPTIQASLPLFQQDPSANAQRQTFGADLATLYMLHRDDDTAACGVAYEYGAIRQPDGSYLPNSNNNAFAYSVNGTGEGQAGSIGCYVYTVAHELGHNLGANHDTPNGGGFPYPYSTGGTCGATAADIMAAPYLRTDAVLIYSNPAITNQGQACGVPDAIDNTRAVNQDYDLVSAYLAPPVAFGAVGFAESALTVAEDSGTLTLHLQRDGSLSGAASVEVAAVGDARADQPATEGVDFATYVQRVSFTAGVSAVDVPIRINLIPGNTGTRNLVVAARYPVGLTLGSNAIAAITITDTTVPSILQFSANTYSVDETGTAATITVARSASTVGAVSVAYATSNGTATSGSDYAAASGTLTWADGDGAPKTFTVPITDDSIFEGNETVSLAISAPTGGATLGSLAAATLTIVDNEVARPGSLQIAAAAYSSAENGGNVTVTVTRSGGSDGAVSVAYATADGSATAGSDYTAASGTLNWANGDAAPKSFTVAVIDDTVNEANETVNLMITAPTGGATLGSPATSVLTILDNDAPPPPPPPPPPAPSGSGGGSANPLMLAALAGLRLLRRRRDTTKR